MAFGSFARKAGVPSIKNFSDRPQGLANPFGGRLRVREAAALTREGHTMSEQAVEERQTGAWDIVWVVLYSILVLLLMLAWVYVPA